MFYSNKYALRPADRIITPIFATGISKHHAVFLGPDHAGVEWIAENYYSKGVRLVKALDFFAGVKSFTIKKFEGDYEQRVSAVQRALTKLGQPYDLINYNCEHFAEYVQTGIPNSNQAAFVKDLLKCTAVCVLAVGLVKLIGKN